MHISLPGIPTIYNHKVFLLSFSLIFPTRSKVPRILLLWMIQNCMYYFMDFTVLAPFSGLFCGWYRTVCIILRGYYGWMIQNCIYYFMDFTVLSPFIFAFILSNVFLRGAKFSGLYCWWCRTVCIILWITVISLFISFSLMVPARSKVLRIDDTELYVLFYRLYCPFYF